MEVRTSITRVTQQPIETSPATANIARRIYTKPPLRGSKSFKVTDFDTNRKPISDNT